MEMVVITYIPMIFPSSNQWDTLFASQQSIPLNPISYFLLFLFILLLSLKFKFKFKTKTKTKSPPSPPKLPIIGNLHQLGPLPHQSLASLSQKHGPIMLLKLGQIPTLIISSASLAKQVMKTHDTIFSNRAQNGAAKSLFYNCRDVSFAHYGEQWKQARKLCFTELLSPKRVESFQYVRDQEVEELVKIIGRACGVVNLKQLLLSTTNNIVSRCVLGGRFADEDGKSRFCGVARKVMILLARFCVGDALPWLWWVDALRGFYAELKTTFETMDVLFDEVIEEHRVKMGSGDKSGEKDFVDIMLGLLQQDHTLQYHFTMDDFKALLLDMFVGGTDTTTTILEWTMAELMRNPTAMKKVQQEVRTIVGQKQKIQPKDIHKMEYMQCVMKESLRLHPPIPLLLPRETSSDVTLDGFKIRSKTSVWVNVWAIQRDPKIWKRPNEFIPERFMEETKSVDFKGQDFELVPFGSGRRHCVGMGFGVASFECVLANLLYWFDWKKLPGEMDMAEEHGLSVFKKLPLQLIPILPASL